MFAYPAPLRRDPLFSPEDRFPLGPPQRINCQEGPSGAATRPFSLHHVVPSVRLDTAPAREEIGSLDYQATSDAGPGPGSRLVNSTLPPAEADTGDVLAELARFFAVAVDSAQVCPMFSTYIDQAWHTLLATPDSYAQFSWEACGQVLGHQASLGEGRIPWVSDYEVRFGKLSPLWFADATGAVDQTAYASYRATGETFRSWDCNPTTNEDE